MSKLNDLISHCEELQEWIKNTDFEDNEIKKYMKKTVSFGLGYLLGQIQHQIILEDKKKK